MRRMLLWAGAVALVCVLALPVFGQWIRDDLSCVRETGETFETGYVSRSYATAVCNALNRFETFLGTAEALSLRLRLNPNPDGERNTAYPCVATDLSDCKDPAPATLACNNSAHPSLVGLATGSAFSHDQRQYFSGTGAATATLSIVQVSGDDAATEGWALDGDDLEHDGGETGSGVFRIRGTITGNDVDCGLLNWSYVAPPSTDSTAPTVPTDIRTVAGDGIVTISGDAPSDPCGDEECTGVEDIQLQLNGSGTLATVAVASGYQCDPTLTNIGSLSPTPTAMQSGADWTLVSAGTMDGTADAHAFVGCPISGAGFVTVKVNAITNTADYAKAGVQRRATTDAGSVKIEAVAMRLADGTLQLNVSRRATTGVSRVSYLTQALTALPVWLKLEWTATNLHDVSYSANGVDFTRILDDELLSFPAQTLAGIAATATTGGGGATMTGDLDQFSLNNVPRWSYEHTTATGGTYAARARDLEGTPNVSAYSATVAGAPLATTPDPGSAIKWHPGHYAWPFGQNGIGPFPASSLSTRNAIKSFIDSIVPYDKVLGISLYVEWGSLEGDVAGDYQYGFTWVDEILAYAEARGKRIDILFSPWRNGGISSDWGLEAFPEYLVQAERGGNCGPDATCPYGIDSPGGHFKVARVWEQPTMDRVIALVQAYGARYNSESHFEMFSLWEDYSMEPYEGAAGFSHAAMNAQVQRLINAIRPAWPNTIVRITSAWPPTSAYTIALAENAWDDDSYIAHSAADTIPHRISYGDRVYLGIGGEWGTHDYRGETHYVAAVQWASLCDLWNSAPGPAEDNYTAQDFYEFAQNDGNSQSGFKPNQPSHWVWAVNMPGTYCSVGHQTWTGTGGHRETIQSGTMPVQSACPSHFSSCDTD